MWIVKYLAHPRKANVKVFGMAENSPMYDKIQRLRFLLIAIKKKVHQHICKLTSYKKKEALCK